MIELLRRAAAASPDRDAVITVEGSLTYAAAVAAAEGIARDLRQRRIARFGCTTEDARDVVVALAAASAAGVEACVYPRGLGEDDVTGLAARLGHETVITDRPLLGSGPASLRFADLGVSGEPLLEPPTRPHLMLTTGTSGAPKGVRHGWDQLVGRVGTATTEPDARWLMAYNLNQFAAMQVLLHGFAHGSTVVVPRSTHARDALEALEAHAVTHVSATPTFWRLLVGSLGEQTRLPALRQITMGGEAAPELLMERLAAAFPDARRAHVYAGTEFGSALAVTDGRSGLPLSVLDRDNDAAVRFRVVEGELLVRSSSAMLGYHGGDAADEWIATGDLVEQRGDRLHFVGRTVEIINVGGAKIHPLPVEERVGRVAGVLVCSAYGSPNAITGQIVALDVVTSPEVDHDAVKDAIHAACSDLAAASRPRRIRFVDALELRGEKVVRREQDVSV